MQKPKSKITMAAASHSSNHTAKLLNINQGERHLEQNQAHQQSDFKTVPISKRQREKWEVTQSLWQKIHKNILVKSGKHRIYSDHLKHADI